MTQRHLLGFQWRAGAERITQDADEEASHRACPPSDPPYVNDRGEDEAFGRAGGYQRSFSTKTSRCTEPINAAIQQNNGSTILSFGQTLRR